MTDREVSCDGAPHPCACACVLACSCAHVMSVSEPVLGEPDGGRRGGLTIDDPRSVVVEFPIDTGAGMRSLDAVSMWEQLALAAFLQRHWSDNQVRRERAHVGEEEH
jgi:hypothetical protein